MPRRLLSGLGGVLLAGAGSGSAWAGPGEAETAKEDSAPAVDAMQKDPVGPPPAVEVVRLPKTRHNLYSGFTIMGGVTNYDTLPPIRLAGGLGVGFRMGGRIVEPFALGASINAIFSLAPRSGTSGSFLVEASVFPLKKRDYQGLAIHLGVGAVSLTRREPDTGMAGIDITQGEFVTTGGLAAMAAIGWDFWLKDRFNFGLHARLDGGLVNRPAPPQPEAGSRSLIFFPSLELALNWY